MLKKSIDLQKRDTGQLWPAMSVDVTPTMQAPYPSGRAGRGGVNRSWVVLNRRPPNPADCRHLGTC
ncbi:hypothetical protein O7606_12315 [Micromonospora sp. WMMD882]|uniref:hypothetical protein n=1 Tax=Micromonospora sp. WMMD882 TaxID=3015151 RepID=UPI00248C1B91|nr:hypothetical protein [Micromonospora sp. WMMD882]WBB82074.1 hypothetical protein O7606_12315 [Micromonospora sp. WMMD882]